MRLRSVELELPDIAPAADFFERVWGLAPAGSVDKTRYWRGTGDHPYVLSLTQAAAPSVAAVTFSGSAEEVAQTCKRAGSPPMAKLDVPGGGEGFETKGPESQTYRFIIETNRPAKLTDPEKPIQVTHVVINSTDVDASERFAVDKLGFKVSDRTGHMRFLRCNRKHHALAYAKSQFSSLNHIAFEMRDIDAVMRGIGRMRDAGIEPVWGPGRHGPGNNVFGYFVAPYGGVVEYTAEVGEVDDNYKVGGPEDWKWPPGRTDHWGVSRKDMARIAPAEKVFRFKNSG